MLNNTWLFPSLSDTRFLSLSFFSKSGDSPPLSLQIGRPYKGGRPGGGDGLRAAFGSLWQWWLG